MPHFPMVLSSRQSWAVFWKACPAPNQICTITKGKHSKIFCHESSSHAHQHDFLGWASLHPNRHHRMSSWRLAAETPPWLSHFSSAKAQSSQDRVESIKQTKRKQQENSSFVTFQSLLKLKFQFLVAMVHHLLEWKEKSQVHNTNWS